MVFSRKGKVAGGHSKRNSGARHTHFPSFPWGLMLTIMSGRLSPISGDHGEGIWALKLGLSS